eukprot:693744-Hanusia_phi.AAC.2
MPRIVLFAFPTSTKPFCAVRSSKSSKGRSLPSPCITAMMFSSITRSSVPTPPSKASAFGITGMPPAALTRGDTHMV